MTHNNVPNELRNERQRLEEGMSDDEDFELIEILDNEIGEDAQEEGADTDEEPDEPIEEDDSYEPLKDDSIRSFAHHRAAVFVCSVSPCGNMIASGGEDDRFIVTEASSGNVLLDCNDFFQDSVNMVGFNHDGKYVSACDMTGQMAVWKVQPDSQLSCIYKDTVGGVCPSSWSKWHSKSNVLLVGGLSVWLFKFPSAQVKLIHEGLVETDCGEFMPDGKRAAIGFSDGTIRLFDLATGATTCKFSPESTQLPQILTMAVHPDNNLIAVGTIDAKIALFKTQQPKTVAILQCSEDLQLKSDSSTEFPEHYISTEAVLFVDVEGMSVVVAGTDHAIHIWDYMRQVLRHRILVEDGVTRMVWREKSLNFFVGTRKGPVNVFNALSGVQNPSLEGHKSSILDLALSSNGKLLVTSGSDGAVKMFNIAQYS
ncbi:WD domain, G-beta repeat [Nesidiocoris tenuis]|uniref:WD domain, G-beta repeat n=1 Tax=Nesidiocoris tenuis TaxID=355587 RepID=A0ABN7AAW0_9HEMI|nr:WD domain, G-beta repeat [Nesidiocoris tenuis]